MKTLKIIHITLISLSYLFVINIMILFFRAIYYLGNTPDTFYTEANELNQLVFQANLTFPLLGISVIALLLSLTLGILSYSYKMQKTTKMMWLSIILALILDIVLVYFNPFYLFTWAAG